LAGLSSDHPLAIIAFLSTSRLSFEEVYSKDRPANCFFVKSISISHSVSGIALVLVIDLSPSDGKTRACQVEIRHGGISQSMREHHGIITQAIIEL